MMPKRAFKGRGIALVLLLTGALASACGGNNGSGDDDGGTTGPTIADLAGTWIASPNNPGTGVTLTHPLTVVDVTQPPLGGTVRLEISNAGRFTLMIDIAALQIAETITGVFTIGSSNSATLAPDGGFDPLVSTFALSGDFLNLDVLDARFLDLAPPTGIGPEDGADIDATFARS